MGIQTAILVGSGNVAHVLGKSLIKAGIQIQSIHSQTPAHALVLANTLQTEVSATLDQLPPADLAIVAVSDDRIEEVSAALPTHYSLVIHCSGSIPLEDLKVSGARGVFYPFQTFTREREITLDQVPVFIEVSEPEALESLKQLALSLGATPYQINSDFRRKLHLAGVMANNFTNHLLNLSMQWLESQNIPKAVLYPLLFETLSKAIELGPDRAQTGPARRGDQNTLSRHREMLADQPELRKLYDTFTESIKQHRPDEPNSLSS